MVAHPDTASHDSALVFIGDVAEIAYLVKVNKVYGCDAGQDAAKFFVEGIRESDSTQTVSDSLLGQAVAQLKITALKSANRYDSLIQLSTSLFDRLEEQVSTMLLAQKVRAVHEEIALIGALEKMKVLAFTVQDISHAEAMEYHKVLNLLVKSPRLQEVRNVAAQQCDQMIEKLQAYSKQKSTRFEELSNRFYQAASNPLEKNQNPPEVVETFSSISASFKATDAKLETCKKKLKY
ncbi:hypothetical protein Ctha_2270 [Chloroherpeton thalassium ATCC 35110]|uniref:Uncharacterized protein n=2 Tax=Chloroherpeton thalassium TaxID=100716 RepID=B3QWG1_CHLT3|nr:hypothetical protein Ctha_2270 [Chloroherpeton thalassium ATCC 35110]